jgi:hypothetical protein
MGIRFNWIVHLLYLAFLWYSSGIKYDFLEVFIKYIYMAFGVGWGPQICNWPGPLSGRAHDITLN